MQPPSPLATPLGGGCCRLRGHQPPLVCFLVVSSLVNESINEKPSTMFLLKSEDLLKPILARSRVCPPNLKLAHMNSSVSTVYLRVYEGVATIISLFGIKHLVLYLRLLMIASGA